MSSNTAKLYTNMINLQVKIPQKKKNAKLIFSLPLLGRG